MKLFNLLQRISAAPEYNIAFDQKSVTSSQWLRRLVLWQKKFQADINLQRVALFIPDSYEFSAVLVALWLCGKEAWLAPNNLPATTQALSIRVDSFVGEFPQLATISLDELDADVFNADVSRLDLQALETCVLANDASLVLFTSGSSGAPQLIKKSVAQLAAEVEQLEKSFGPALGECRVYATVSHQHIYGLLFRVLWPLVCGRAFCQFTSEYIEYVFKVEGQPLCLISSPTHLTRLPDPIAHQQHVNCVFSSGGPLPSSASTRSNQVFGADIIEVFGSTETGGIGWRRQHRGETAWTLFEAVQAKVNEQQCLVIRSTYLPNDDWFETSDLVSIEAETFTLVGRADRVVKIEGKRVSLEQIEACLLADAWVADVRIEQVVRSGTVANRDELMALVVLSAAGVVALESRGRQVLAKHFKTALGQLLERPLVPRRWRYLDRLPRNSQGKILREELSALIEEVLPLMDRSHG